MNIAGFLEPCLFSNIKPIDVFLVDWQSEKYSAIMKRKGARVSPCKTPATGITTKTILLIQRAQLLLI